MPSSKRYRGLMCRLRAPTPAVLMVGSRSVVSRPSRWTPGSYSRTPRLAIQVTRRTRRLDGAKWSTEIAYAVTDLPAEQAQPADLASWIRGHWCVENRLHWVRDVTYDEDRSQIRTGNGPRAMSSLGNLVLSMLRLHGATNIAQALRHFAWDPRQPVALLLRC